MISQGKHTDALIEKLKKDSEIKAAIGKEGKDRSGPIRNAPGGNSTDVVRKKNGVMLFFWKINHKTKDERESDKLPFLEIVSKASENGKLQKSLDFMHVKDDEAYSKEQDMRIFRKIFGELLYKLSVIAALIKIGKLRYGEGHVRDEKADSHGTTKDQANEVQAASGSSLFNEKTILCDVESKNYLLELAKQILLTGSVTKGRQKILAPKMLSGLAFTTSKTQLKLAYVKNFLDYMTEDYYMEDIQRSIPPVHLNNPDQSCESDLHLSKLSSKLSSCPVKKRDELSRKRAPSEKIRGLHKIQDIEDSELLSHPSQEADFHQFDEKRRIGKYINDDISKGLVLKLDDELEINEDGWLDVRKLVAEFNRLHTVTLAQAAGADGGDSEWDSQIFEHMEHEDCSEDEIQTSYEDDTGLSRNSDGLLTGYESCSQVLCASGEVLPEDETSSHLALGSHAGGELVSDQTTVKQQFPKCRELGGDSSTATTEPWTSVDLETDGSVEVSSSVALACEDQDCGRLSPSAATDDMTASSSTQPCWAQDSVSLTYVVEDGISEQSFDRVEVSSIPSSGQPWPCQEQDAAQSSHYEVCGASPSASSSVTGSLIAQPTDNSDQVDRVDHCQVTIPLFRRTSRTYSAPVPTSPCQPQDESCSDSSLTSLCPSPSMHGHSQVLHRISQSSSSHSHDLASVHEGHDLHHGRTPRRIITSVQLDQSADGALSSNAVSLHYYESSAGITPEAAPAPVRLPPVEVHDASALPPQAATTPLIDLSQAASRQHAQLNTRRATFGEDWPDTEGIDPANVAVAGFYCEEQDGSRIRCFYCGLELAHLTEGDNIWDEHVRHNPTCAYLRAIMGSDLVLRTQTVLEEQQGMDSRK